MKDVYRSLKRTAVPVEFGGATLYFRVPTLAEIAAWDADVRADDTSALVTTVRHFACDADAVPVFGPDDRAEVEAVPLDALRAIEAAFYAHFNRPKS